MDSKRATDAVQAAASSVHVDLNRLLEREGNAVDWKEVGNPEEIAETLAAFANDLAEVGEGWVLCGVKEVKDEHGFRQAHPVGIIAKDLEKLGHQVLAHCQDLVMPPIMPDVRDIAIDADPSRRILVFHIAASRQVHLFKNRCIVRIEDHTRQAKPSQIDELYRRKEIVPYLEQPAPEASKDDIDLLAVEEFLKGLPLPPARYLEPGELVAATARPLMATRRLATGIYATPNRFALVLFGREPTRLFPGAYTILSVYDATTRTGMHSQKFETTGPMVKQVRDVLDKLKLYTGLFIDKSQDMLTGRQNRPRFSDAALQEAFVNALVHRDYEDREPTRITVFSDRIEIVSPGGLMRQIDPERLKAGQAAPHWRNPSLAHFMVRMGFAQQEGQGIPTIIKETVAVSGQPPDFVLEPGRLTVVLPAYQPKREPETPTPPSPSPSPGAAQQDAVILISIGGESVRSAVEPSLAELHLEPGYILVDVASPGYVEPDEAHWRVQAKLIRDALKQWVDAPQYQTFHLFYRGPVVLAPLVAAFIPRDKSLTVYYYHGGKYRVAYTIDRRFRLAKD